MKTASHIVSTEASRVLTVRCAAVRPFPGQPRVAFDQDRLAELASSLKEHGQQVAIIVRELPEPDGEVAFEIIDGERRWRASQIAKLDTIRAEVRGAKDGDHQFVQSVVANFGREDHTPLESALAVQRVCAMPEYAALAVTERHQRVGALFARSHAWVAYNLKLVKLPAEVQELVGGPAGKRLNAQVAIYLGTVADKEEQVRLAKVIVERDLPGPKARLLINQARHKHGVTEGAARSKPSTESRNVFASVQRITTSAEVLLDMPKRGLKRSLAQAPGGERWLVEKIDAAIAALVQVRESLS